MRLSDGDLLLDLGIELRRRSRYKSEAIEEVQVSWAGSQLKLYHGNNQKIRVQWDVIHEKGVGVKETENGWENMEKV